MGSGGSQSSLGQTVMEETQSPLITLADHACPHLPRRRPGGGFGSRRAFAFSELVYLKCADSFGMERNGQYPLTSRLFLSLWQTRQTDSKCRLQSVLNPAVTVSVCVSSNIQVPVLQEVIRLPSRAPRKKEEQRKLLNSALVTLPKRTY